MIQELISSLLTQLTTDKMLTDYKKKHRSNSSAFKPPKYNLGIGIFCMVFFGALFILTIFSSEDMLTKIFCYIVFGVFTVGAFFLILYGQNFLVLYEKGTITYRNIFRITRTYSIKDITHVYYKHSGGIQFIFNDNRILSFDEPDACFYYQIIINENLTCEYKGGISPIIKVCYHPVYMWVFRIIGVGLTALALWNPYFLLFAMITFLYCLGCHLSYTTYDQAHKILTRTRWGFSKQYDLHNCSVEPTYKFTTIISLTIYDHDKRLTTIPVSIELKNRTQLIHTLCDF